MRVVAFSSYGTPDVLRVMEVKDPKAQSGEVRIRVKCAGVMPFDRRVRTGWIPTGLSLSFPIIPGNEFAGIIDQVGEGVQDFSIGDDVLGFTVLNSYAEYVVVSADQIVKKPMNMSWEIAGGFSGNGQGAHMALEAVGVKDGDTVLIHGAAGGLGTFAIQLAKVQGAHRVIGTASAENHDYLRSLGVIPVTYGEGLVERIREIAPSGVDASLDAAGPEALMASVELVVDRSRIQTLVSFELSEALGIHPSFGKRSATRLTQLVDLYVQGKLHIHIRKKFPLHQAADAHWEIESGHGRGKVVLTVGE